MLIPEVVVGGRLQVTAQQNFTSNLGCRKQNRWLKGFSQSYYSLSMCWEKCGALGNDP